MPRRHPVPCRHPVLSPHPALRHLIILWMTLVSTTACGHLSATPIASIAREAPTSAWSLNDYRRFNATTFIQHPPVQQPIDLQRVDFALLHAAILYATNQQRAVHRLPPLTHDPALERAARSHSDDMVAYDFYDHESVVDGKRTLEDRLKHVGVQRTMMAENLAKVAALNYQDGRPFIAPQTPGDRFRYDVNGPPIPPHTYLSLAQRLLDGWMNSPGHRANILRPELKRLGCGVAFTRDPRSGMPLALATQNFAGL